MDDDWYFPAEFLLQIGAVLFALCLAYHFLLAKHADFTIRLRRGRVTYQGKVAVAQQGSIAEFLLQDLDLHGPLKILGRRNKGRLKLWFRGKLSAGEKQRIRNFLAAG
jgi:hypothetical protein